MQRLGDGRQNRVSPSGIAGTQRQQQFILVLQCQRLLAPGLVKLIIHNGRVAFCEQMMSQRPVGLAVGIRQLACLLHSAADPD
ncbi:hypothetical protein D3C78_1893340 [compost metagenome]